MMYVFGSRTIFHTNLSSLLWNCMSRFGWNTKELLYFEKNLASCSALSQEECPRIVCGATLWRWSGRFRFCLGAEQVSGAGREFGWGGIVYCHFSSGARNHDVNQTACQGRPCLDDLWWIRDRPVVKVLRRGLHVTPHCQVVEGRWGVVFCGGQVTLVQNRVIQEIVWLFLESSCSFDMCIPNCISTSLLLLN